MTPLSPGILIAIYIVGFLASIYIGIRISDRMWRKRADARVRRAYRHGWDAGYGFLNRIEDVKTDRESSVTVLR